MRRRLPDFVTTQNDNMQSVFHHATLLVNNTAGIARIYSTNTERLPGSAKKETKETAQHEITTANDCKNVLGLFFGYEQTYHATPFHRHPRARLSPTKRCQINQTADPTMTRTTIFQDRSAARRQKTPETSKELFY